MFQGHKDRQKCYLQSLIRKKRKGSLYVNFIILTENACIGSTKNIAFYEQSIQRFSTENGKTEEELGLYLELQGHSERVQADCAWICNSDFGGENVQMQVGNRQINVSVRNLFMGFKHQTQQRTGNLGVWEQKNKWKSEKILIIGSMKLYESGARRRENTDKYD